MTTPIKKLRDDAIKDLKGLHKLGEVDSSTFRRVSLAIKNGSYDKTLALRDEGLKQYEVTDFILSMER